MAPKMQLWRYIPFILAIRVVILLLLSRLGVGLPFIVSRGSRDIHEFIALSRSLNIKRFMKPRPFFYHIINQLNLYFPSLSVDRLLKFAIFLVDLLAALVLLRLSRTVQEATKEDELRIRASQDPPEWELRNGQPATPETTTCTQENVESPSKDGDQYGRKKEESKGGDKNEGGKPREDGEADKVSRMESSMCSGVVQGTRNLRAIHAQSD